MEVTLRLSHYFEQNSVHCPCPMIAVNGFRLSQRLRRKELLLILISIAVIFLYSSHMSTWNNGSTHGHEDQQPCDGGTGGQSGSSGGRGSGKSDEGGGSHDLPQVPFSGGSGSSSNGDNGDDDPNKKPYFHKAQKPTEVDSEEESDDDTQAHSTTSGKDQMVANPLQPLTKNPEIAGTIRDHTTLFQSQCSNSWTSSPYKSFEHSEHFSMCPLKDRVVIHDASRRVSHQPTMLIHVSTNDEQQPQQWPQSATSIGEEQLNLDLISVASTDNEGILEQFPFYATIPIESFSGPHSASHLGLDVSTESIQALHANTYYELAHLQSVQEQVLQAVQSMEPFDYTLAFMMYDHDGTQLLIPCLPDAEFDPAADVHVVAVPADCVLSHFTVHINPHLQ